MCARPCFALWSKLAVGNIQVRVALFIRWPHFGWIRLKTDLAGSKTLSTTIVRLHSLSPHPRIRVVRPPWIPKSCLPSSEFEKVA
jgi:hypothetical protein